MPRRIQLALRRTRAQIILNNCKGVWPVDARACKPPDNWKGWPDGKRFAVVLTHDVDTAKGQGRCLKLMQLEKSLGFCSSFNFVPRRYEVSGTLREELTNEGFEVGVHGLYHDGKYYSSREEFSRRAKLINSYLKEWNAVGFRSPSMQHNLDWIHDLDIEYDASTFDTDPFEPQSDGVCTIFPFWVQAENGQGGYVELPYTLPQDHLLYVMLVHGDDRIWKEKLDWVAGQGGMALLNTHPDYMTFGTDRPGLEEFPAALYAQFLQHLRDRYDGQYWHALPRDIARFWRTNQSK